MSGATLLAIETSCDETGLAVLRGEGDTVTVLAEVLASQVDIHAATGGVIPEVAAREHVTVLRPLLEQVLQKSGVTGANLDAVAVTVGPGLPPALAVGVTAAQTLAYAWGKPIVPVHHLEGHIYSALLRPSEGATSTYTLPADSLPALALIVSGGHTQLVRVTGHGEYDVIGRTRDDAAGEAFDKVARLLGLPYPGGPAISRLAEQGDSAAFAFTPPMLHSGDLDFSFSGLKTEVRYTWEQLTAAEREEQQANIAASFQAAVVTALIEKTRAAAAAHQPKVLLLAGGVAANALLRRELAHAAAALGVRLQIAPLALCGDNGVMIGTAGLFAYAAGRLVPWGTADIKSRFDLTAAASAAPGLGARGRAR